MQKTSSLKISAIVAVLSFPFWFLMGRFGRELNSRYAGRINYEMKEALIVAVVMTLFTFAVALYGTRPRPRKP